MPLPRLKSNIDSSASIVPEAPSTEAPCLNRRHSDNVAWEEDAEIFRLSFIFISSFSLRTIFSPFPAPSVLEIFAPFSTFTLAYSAARKYLSLKIFEFSAVPLLLGIILSLASVNVHLSWSRAVKNALISAAVK